MQSGNGEVDFLQCYICLQTVKKPRMCPSCSKLACQHCLRTWIEEGKSECPHCRKPLLLGSFADCERFVNDIRQLLGTMDCSERAKEKCGEHRIEMGYYCSDCREAICSDCGMFGQHRAHRIVHLSKVYQENKGRILGELAKLDSKIELFRQHAAAVKQEMHTLQAHHSNKKNFIQDYILTLLERLDEEYSEKKEKVDAKYDENVQEIEFLETFRDNICQELEYKTEKELICKSEEVVGQIRDLCEREVEVEEESYAFSTIHQLVPNYHKFSYKLRSYSQLPDSIVYSEPCLLNGIEWRLKIYPRGNGGAKNTHLSVFLELSKGYENENKYEYKIELLNHLSRKESTVREYSSKFDIGECWGYNQFIPIAELPHGFLDGDDGLQFTIGVRNPTYRSLVRDQEKYIQVLQNRLNCIESPQPQLRKEKMNELAQLEQPEALQKETKEEQAKAEEAEVEAEQLEGSLLRLRIAK